jgi:hypothetical protein
MRCFCVVVLVGLLSSVSFAAPALTSYVGRDPRVAVQGVSFLRHPTVLAGVAKAVPAGYVRQWVLSADDDAGWHPVRKVNGWLVIYACERHMCGPHNWTIMIDPASAATVVCNHDEEGGGKGEGKTGRDKVRWYYSSGQTEIRDGDPASWGCPNPDQG